MSKMSSGAKRLTVLTIYNLIERTFKWQKGTYQVTETGTQILVDFGKSQIRRTKLINAIYDIQSEMRQLFGETFTTYYKRNSVELWLF